MPNMLDADAKSSEPPLTLAPVCSNNNLKPSLESERKSSERYALMDNSIKKWVHSVTSKTKLWEIMKDDFGKVARKKFVVTAFKSMMEQLESAVLEEIEAMMEANNVHQKLVELDDICALPCEQTWRPSGNPDEDIKAHLSQVSQEEVDKLQKIADLLECQNQALNESSLRNDAQVQNLIRKIEVCESKWKEAASSVTKDTQSKLIDALMRS